MERERERERWGGGEREIEGYSRDKGCGFGVRYRLWEYELKLNISQLLNKHNTFHKTHTHTQPPHSYIHTFNISLACCDDIRSTSPIFPAINLFFIILARLTLIAPEI